MRKRRQLRVREQKLAAKTVSLLFLSLIILVAAFFIGPTLIVRFSLLLNPLENQGEENLENLQIIFPPNLDILPIATNSATIDITGSGQKDQTISLRRNGFLVGQISVLPDGTFLFTQVRLTEGENIFIAQALADGQESKTSQPIKIIYKKEAPEIQIFSPNSGETLSEDKIEIKGQTDEGASVSINNRLVPVSGNGSFSFLVKLSEGKNNFTIKATDIAGNETEYELTLFYQP